MRPSSARPASRGPARPLSATTPKPKRPQSAHPGDLGMTASGLRVRGEPAVPGQVEFDSEDDVDIDQLFEEFARNPFREQQERTKETDAAAMKAAQKMKDELAPDRKRTMRFIRDIQRRTEASMRRIAEQREKLDGISAGASGIAEHKTAREAVEAARAKSRSNLYERLRTLATEDFKDRLVAESEKAAQEYEDRLAEAERKLQASERQREQTEADLSAVRAENDSLKHVLTLLRQKLQLTTEREIENQRRLKLFTKLEPIFEELSRHFNFNSPAEVLQRLQRLEEGKMELYTRQSELEEQRDAAERRIEQLLKGQEAAVQAAVARLQHEIDRANKRAADLQAQLDSTRSQLGKATQMEDRYLTLWHSVVDLWNKWSQSALVDRSSAMELPDMSNPLQVLQAVNHLFTLHEPTQSAMKLRELSGLANTFWMKYFSTQPELKARPREIFMELANSYDLQKLQTEKLERELKRQQMETRETKDELEKAQRQIRALQYELDERQKALARKLARPTSASVLGRSSGRGPAASQSIDVSLASEPAAPAPTVPAAAADATADYYSDIGSLPDRAAAPPLAVARTAYARPATAASAPIGGRLSLGTAPPPAAAAAAAAAAGSTGAPRPLAVSPRSWAALQQSAVARAGSTVRPKSRQTTH